MQASQMNELHYLLNLQPNLSHFPCDSSNNITAAAAAAAAAHHHQYSSQNISNNNNPQYQVYNVSPGPDEGQGQEVRAKWTCLSSNSNSTTSDEATEMNVIIHERKQRRMISNRESARRSRMRKQRHLDELWSQVVWLRNENQHLMEKLNNASDNQGRLLEENSHLKEEVSDLRTRLVNLDHYSTSLL